MNERDQTPEQDTDIGPTTEQMIEATRDFLSEEDLDRFETMEPDELLIELVSLLDARGHDPEEFLRERGLINFLENDQEEIINRPEY